MDCSWGYGLNKACDGGDYDAAMDWLKLAGGPVQEKDYEYLGADAFCRDRNFSSGQRATFEVLTCIICCENQKAAAQRKRKTSQSLGLLFGIL